ncbi:helix-turn-helix domain-containing protein [Kitasatospora acidiphila]|uniref:helix-turn-helix domain-containing protein n=1 Tax=Kitasatospora acidiphila TaxID=2567942 RepID=UPI002B400104|nr:LysR family transcriptional regulator [Kitasatospora acidiphila]
MLCAMADCGSVGRAAALLGYSQQALSGQLQRIENHFGQPCSNAPPTASSRPATAPPSWRRLAMW